MVIIVRYQMGLYPNRDAICQIAILNPGDRVQTFGIQHNCTDSGRAMIQVHVLGTNPVMSGWVFVDQLQ